MDASVRQFCASARARLQECADFDAKRQFFLGHVERVIYNRYKVTIAGSVPVQSASGDTKLPFRIEGEIDGRVVRSRPQAIRAEDDKLQSVTELHEGKSHAGGGRASPRAVRPSVADLGAQGQGRAQADCPVERALARGTPVSQAKFDRAFGLGPLPPDAVT